MTDLSWRMEDPSPIYVIMTKDQVDAGWRILCRDGRIETIPCNVMQRTEDGHYIVEYLSERWNNAACFSELRTREEMRSGNYLKRLLDQQPRIPTGGADGE